MTIPTNTTRLCQFESAAELAIKTSRAPIVFRTERKNHAMAKTQHFCTGSGRINLEMTLAQARTASHSGSCDDDVRWLSQQKSIVDQLDEIDASLLADELREYGAWDDEELKDHDQNLQRLVWIAAGDIVDNAA